MANYYKIKTSRFRYECLKFNRKSKSYLNIFFQDLYLRLVEYLCKSLKRTIFIGTEH